MSVPSRIVLTGFSGTGKSAVAPLLAQHFSWDVVDTDRLVEEREGKPILTIFRDAGEDAFRDLESAAIADACAQDDVIISAGGGAVLRAENRQTLAKAAFVVCLEARPQTILARLTSRGNTEQLDRPLLASDDPLSRITELKAARQHLYALCDWAVHTDGLTPEQVAAEIIRARDERADDILAAAGRVEAMTAPAASAPARTLHAVPEGAACMVGAASGEYPVFVGWGTLSGLGGLLRDAGLNRFAYVISDETVWHHLGDEVEASLRGAGIEFDSYTVPPGEASKSLDTASALYDWLIDHRAERGHTIVAVGGGVVTDLGGYVAATFARGIPLVHVPTSMLGQVDAAIGGKVAVNHPRAKNMIGVFQQPRLVLADIAVMRTLPEREIRSGLAEAIKMSFLDSEEHVAFLEDNADAILKLDRDATVEAVRRSVCFKAAVVSEDEFETTGRRSVLNYGHTLAHAIESTTGYSRFRHGEADGIGMMAAGQMSVAMDLLAPQVLGRQRALLERCGLPTSADGLDRQRLLDAVALDKKVQDKKVRWVLLEGVGRPVLRDDVPGDVVASALDSVLD
ncbi:MAG: 3-dehydroquinate synthase [Chloroflexi bacterium]|nr:3-dehydroquinate synthase [Chloroflexota bacterium]MCI0885805.1 3-dehydroquinate synthase [Chloroflexota bacterium]